MLAKLRPRSVYDVLAAIGFFVAVSTGGAYAANTVFSTDIVDGEVKTPDIANVAVTGNKSIRGRSRPTSSLAMRSGALRSGTARWPASMCSTTRSRAQTSTSRPSPTSVAAVRPAAT
jgi:hypothetical protein